MHFRILMTDVDTIRHVELQAEKSILFPPLFSFSSLLCEKNYPTLLNLAISTKFVDTPEADLEKSLLASVGLFSNV